MNSLEPSDVLALFRATSRKLFLPKFTFSALIVSNCTSSFRDRKSTRLNSSHSQISYAVFCLKKKIHRIHSHDCWHQLVATSPIDLANLNYHLLCLPGFRLPHGSDRRDSFFASSRVDHTCTYI